MKERNMFTAQRKAMLISWALWFAGIFATTILAVVKTNLDKGIFPPVTVSDLVSALWAAVGAAAAVAIQYLDSKYTRYGVGAPVATPAEGTTPQA
jgi:hypothetical protein